MNTTLKKIVNTALALILLETLLSKTILGFKQLPSLRRLRRIRKKL